MIYVLLLLWVMGAILAIRARKIFRMIVYLGVFSMISAICFLMLGAPDVAMAEAAVSTFSTIFLIICFEKYFVLVSNAASSAPHAPATLNAPNASFASTAPNVTAAPNAPATPATPAAPNALATPIASATPTGKRRASASASAAVAASASAAATALAAAKRYLPPLLFTALLFALFVRFIPASPANAYIKDMYLARFMGEVGGENAVTAIYLGYRMYDTLFEALMLLVGVVAVSHMSWYNETAADEHLGGINKSDSVAIYTIRMVCPVILLFALYLILNGHMSPGGGFQGGVAIASFLVCRYLIHNINDVHYKKVLILEKMTFAAIVLLALFFILLGTYVHYAHLRTFYLITMNTLIGMKVACGFSIIFYRYIAFERR
ncbi:MAG: DUF4040 domain-containing protein [Oscillospiraceae bacterium]|nr:DUF4040 domain-containing protein [Oscillospiraceae bacterium]